MYNIVIIIIFCYFLCFYNLIKLKGAILWQENPVLTADKIHFLKSSMDVNAVNADLK